MTKVGNILGHSMVFEVALLNGHSFEVNRCILWWDMWGYAGICGDMWGYVEICGVNPIMTTSLR